LVEQVIESVDVDYNQLLNRLNLNSLSNIGVIGTEAEYGGLYLSKNPSLETLMFERLAYVHLNFSILPC